MARRTSGAGEPCARDGRRYASPPPALCRVPIHPIESLTHSLEQDGKSIMSGTAVKVAKENVPKIARADL